MQLENLCQQREAAKEEAGKPFPQEEELREKSARLLELDMELNMDGMDRTKPALEAAAKSERSSVLDRLKTQPVHGPTDKTGGKTEWEVR